MGCGYVCPVCEGKEWKEDGSRCDWCNQKDSKQDEELQQWIEQVHEGPCCSHPDDKE